ncbi:BTAD domain-containing putative transcriptional regulator [Streptomyces phyllanthi]|nr:BTAD domain-containing putative transcriptional regulator [Streptomyces phyllanthi]
MLDTSLPENSGLEIRILGPLDIQVGSRRMELRAPRLQATLGLLLLRADEIVPVQHLVESIWEDAVPSDPSNQVAACVSMLRRSFRKFGVNKELLITQSPGYRFVAEGVRLDTSTVRRLRSLAQTHIDADDPLSALPLVKEALSLWRGPVLSGISRRIWAPEVHRWEEEYVSLRNLCSSIQLALGQHEELIAELTVFAQQHPLLEHPRVTLMQALARSGRQADALQIYRDTVALLRDELGVSPGEELQKVHQQILRGSEFSAPRQQSTFPPTGAKPASSAPCQLPSDLAEFTGRVDEINRIKSFLVPASGSVPLVSLVGPGGTGKTALAVHSSHQLRSVFTDGQLYVNLRGMSDDPVSPDEALARFLRELRLPGPIPEALDERAEVFRSLLADRRILIVLDDASDPHQVLPLIPGTGTCAVIVTSRARLTTLPSTHVLELDVFHQTQAVTLLGRLVGDQRISAEPDIALQLIEYCGRLPLAVRILGAKLASKPHWSLRKASLRLADERRRLDELTHESLEVRANLELSRQGISPAARKLFRRLALVTAADFAEWVCSPLTDLPLPEAEDLLEELLDARLIDVVSPEDAGQHRYRMHDLVRLYALEQVTDLEPREERTAALTRLGLTTLALANRAHRAVCGGDFAVVHNLAQPPSVPSEILDRVGSDPLNWYETDRGTITALCQQLSEQGQDELSWDLAATSRCLFSLRFHFDDWQSTHEGALEAARVRGNERGAAAMLLGLGDLYLTKRNYEQAIPLLEESQRLFEQVGDDHGHALALRKAACADRVQGRFAQALSRWDVCLPILQRAHDIEAQGQVLRWMGQTFLETGEYEQAEKFLLEARTVVDGFEGRSAAQVRLSLGEYHLFSGNLEQAAEEFTWGLEATLRNGDLSGQCYAFYGLGQLDLHHNELTQAESRLSLARDLARRIQDPLLESFVILGLASVKKEQKDTDTASALLAEGLSICHRMGARAHAKRFQAALTALRPA